MEMPHNTPPPRFIPTGSIGVEILKLCFLKELGWIIRDIDENDMGIDANVEYVKDGFPMAKYISIQLKTGYGNVKETKEYYVYTFNSVHYQYWLSSSIPVILAFCDPDKEIVYWELLKKRNIKRAGKKYKIFIKKDHILNKESLEELETIIDTYQSDFNLPDCNNEEDIDMPKYISSLYEICAEVLQNCYRLYEQIAEMYKKNIQQMFGNIVRLYHIENNDDIQRDIRTQAKVLILATNTFKAQIQVMIQVIIQTYIEAIRLTETFLQQLGDNVSDDIVLMFKVDLKQSYTSIIECANVYTDFVNMLEELAKQDTNTGLPYNSLAFVFGDYCSSLTDIAQYISQLIEKIGEFNVQTNK